MEMEVIFMQFIASEIRDIAGSPIAYVYVIQKHQAVKNISSVSHCLCTKMTPIYVDKKAPTDMY